MSVTSIAITAVQLYLLVTVMYMTPIYLLELYRSAMPLSLCEVVVDEDLTAPSSTFDTDEQAQAHDSPLQFAFLVQQVMPSRKLA